MVKRVARGWPLLALAFWFLYPNVTAALTGPRYGGSIAGIVTIGFAVWLLIALARDHRAGLWRWWWES